MEENVGEMRGRRRLGIKTKDGIVKAVGLGKSNTVIAVVDDHSDHLHSYAHWQIYIFIFE